MRLGVVSYCPLRLVPPERSVTGTLNITTVFAGDPDAKSFRAVHVRHDYLPMSLPGFQSEPSVSQHYGVCESVK